MLKKPKILLRYKFQDDSTGLSLLKDEILEDLYIMEKEMNQSSPTPGFPDQWLQYLYYDLKKLKTYNDLLKWYMNHVGHNQEDTEEHFNDCLEAGGHKFTTETIKKKEKAEEIKRNVGPEVASHFDSIIDNLL
jgi:hypothetical protein